MKGSIPEEDAGKLYNTCAVFGPDGALLVKHRKVSLECGSLVATWEFAMKPRSPSHHIVHTAGIWLVGTDAYSWLLVLLFVWYIFF